MIQNEEEIFSFNGIKNEFVTEQAKECLKCPFCGSFFIERNLCEMCGKVSNYSPIKILLTIILIIFMSTIFKWTKIF